MHHIHTPPIPKKKSEKLYYGNLHGCAQAYAIAQVALQSDVLLVITDDIQASYRLQKALSIFLGNKPDIPVLCFPDWETLPYDQFSPHQDIISERLFTLNNLQTAKKGIFIVAVSTIVHRLAPVNYVSAYRFSLKIGQSLSIEQCSTQLLHCGYHHVPEVITHGEFSIRGNIIDIFPMGQPTPIRIELFDEEIESLRFFNPETQRSQEKIDAFTCLPARECPLTQDSITLFRQKWRAAFEGDPSQCSLYQDVSQGTPANGIEYYLPLFFETTSTLFDFLPADTLIVRFQNTQNACTLFWEKVHQRFEQYSHDYQRPILPPHSLFIQTNELFENLNQFPQILIGTEAFEKSGAGKINFDTLPFPSLVIDHKAQNPLHLLAQFIDMQAQSRILFCVESAGRREALFNLLQYLSLRPKAYTHWADFFESDSPFGITIAPIEEGLWLTERNWIWISESQLYGLQVMQRRYRKKSHETIEASIRTLTELKLDAPVVHIDHGVGRYRGLVHLTISDIQAEYLLIEYANKDKLYVPVSSLHLISQYSASNIENAPLHKLGTDQWEKAKKKASEKAWDVAAELLNVNALRALKKGHTFPKPSPHYFQFSASFPFEETPDQAKAIEAVLQDMQSEKPMDRLICGDVGFGKTEVALRAAFLAVEGNKQVILLAPTTLLAQQHYETFSDRFADWPIQVAVLSRFCNKKAQQDTLEKLKDGKIDILIGTHKLLQTELVMSNLGLVIIDEEHRFGVRQKEFLKTMRKNVDLLTLTATPIPRTLNMSLASLRDLSIIATPPAKRLSIKTFVQEYNANVVQEALTRELLRGGQAYYLHNDVKTIEKTAHDLSTLLPKARIHFAHGQMRESELERVMSDFYHQRFHILVCTTIIETGIDIPTANTIIIERADKLGLAQLHQLRGRVGRSHHQAYAYCLTPPKKQLSSDALKRLEALGSLEELGSGFTLATHDLEIRGAGELLGDEQSGSIHTIGFSLYMELLDKAVHSLRSGTQEVALSPLSKGAEIDLQMSALIPEDFIPDVHTRLILYKRIANAKTKDALHELQVEIIDRFGLLPENLKNLFQITQLKLKAYPIGIKKITVGKTSGKIEFEPTPNLNPETIISMVREAPKQFSFTGANKLNFTFPMPTPQDRMQKVAQLLEKISL